MEKTITEKEIDYLKHWQGHNMFNYNVKYNRFFSYLLIFIPIISLFFASFLTVYYNNPYFYQNFSYISPIHVFLITSILFLILILVFYPKFKEGKEDIEKSFRVYHKKIKRRYDKIGVNTKCLDEPNNP